MRMWMVDPKVMCKNHLLGEHFELHLFVDAINRKQKLIGYLKNGILEIHSIQRRHEQLVKEMARRGYTHKTPLASFKVRVAGKVNPKASRKELAKRCRDCRNLQMGVIE